MARTRTGTTRHKKHKKVLAAAKGFRQARSKHYKAAREAVLHAGQYAYIGRKQKKRDLRSLWITRLNAAAREHNISYSQFINSLKKANIEINRKLLADIAIRDPEAFSQIVQNAKAHSNH